MSARTTYANDAVLAFYKDLPFNYHGSSEEQAKMVRARDHVQAYPILPPLLHAGCTVLEVGCGVGWFALSLSLHHHCAVTAIDFNPVAISRARELAASLKQNVRFEHADLFLYEPEAPAEVVVSLGVLHHTDNCLAAIERICTHFVRPGGHIMIGLYHLYGRQPFLDHFDRMKRAGASEDAMFQEYRRLHSQFSNEVFARSWFRDQVLHPKETQHTLEEVMPILQRTGMQLVSTSINQFKPIQDLPSLFTAEKSLRQRGEAALAEGRYFPGFFVFLAKKTATTAAPQTTSAAGTPPNAA